MFIIMTKIMSEKVMYKTIVVKQTPVFPLETGNIPNML